MEARLTGLEEFVAEMKKRLGRIEMRLEEMATKAELAALQGEMNKGFADMVKWVVGTAMALGATGLTVITFVLNNATPKPVQSSPAPIIIYAQPVAAAPAKMELAPGALPSKN